MWHLTCDTWHLTPDMWNLTRDTWHVTHGGGWRFSQNFSFLALTVWDLWCCKNLEEKADSLNYKGVYRTALATPGLLNRQCCTALGHSKSERMSKSHHCFKSYSHFSRLGCVVAFGRVFDQRGSQDGGLKTPLGPWPIQWIKPADARERFRGWKTLVRTRLWRNSVILGIFVRAAKDPLSWGNNKLLETYTIIHNERNEGNLCSYYVLRTSRVPVCNFLLTSLLLVTTKTEVCCAGQKVSKKD